MKLGAQQNNCHMELNADSGRNKYSESSSVCVYEGGIELKWVQERRMVYSPIVYGENK